MYPTTAPEIAIPELDGKTAKMYRYSSELVVSFWYQGNMWRSLSLFVSWFICVCCVCYVVYVQDISVAGGFRVNLCVCGAKHWNCGHIAKGSDMHCPWLRNCQLTLPPNSRGKAGGCKLIHTYGNNVIHSRDVRNGFFKFGSVLKKKPPVRFVFFVDHS